MNTIFVKSDSCDYSAAAGIINSGGLVAFPTETVYGLGGSALDPQAASKIYRAKGRPSDNPLIVHLTKASQAEDYAYTNELYYRLTDAFSPGPLTIILPKKDIIPTEVTGGLQTVALRIPSHKVAREFIAACGVPIAAPSANLSGRPSPTTAAHVKDDLDGRIDMIIDGGDCDIGVESTVVKLDGDKIIILRPGAVTEEMLGRIAPVGRDKSLLEKPTGDFRPEAPGMKYRHYAPKSPVYMVRGSDNDVSAFMQARLAENPKTGILCYYSERRLLKGDNVMYIAAEHEKQAHELFGILRAFDKTDAEVIYSVVPSRLGCGFAVLNRLTKAAGFKSVRADGDIKVIGLTGQSGAGKGEAAEIFRKNGFFTVDCDRVYASLLYHGSPLLNTLKSAFGDEIILPDGTLNRVKLSSVVFSDREKLELLNRLTHSAVLTEVRKIIAEKKLSGQKLFVVDAPQLFESGFDSECDAVVGICAPEEIRVQRLTSRDGRTEAQIRERLRSQHDEEFFRVYCDYTADNGSTLAGLEAEIDKIIKKIQEAQ